MAVKSIKVKIVSKSGDKTVKGEAISLRKHPKYEKYVRVRKTFLIHDESNKVKVGDEVFIAESKPISKTKNWIIVDGEK